MKKEQLKELKQIANSLKPQFNLGKSGITEKFIETIDNYLTAHNILKVKALIAEDKSSLEYLANEIAKETNSTIIDKRGFTFVVYRDNN